LPHVTTTANTTNHTVVGHKPLGSIPRGYVNLVHSENKVFENTRLERLAIPREPVFGPLLTLFLT
jgi:hypothetical protein